MTIKTYSKKNN